MPAHIVSDSESNIHYLLTQEFDQSCGPACVAMANSIYKQICTEDPEGAARRISQQFTGSYHPDLGTMMSNLVNVMTAMNIRNHGVQREASGSDLLSGIYANVTETRPAILHVEFNNGAKHFVLCVRVLSGDRVVVLDPWYGLQEVNGNRLPAYAASCAARGRCTAGQQGPGNFSLWVIYTR